jgi:hypothetical protein
MNALIPLLVKLLPAKWVAFLDGKKTYICAAIAAATAAAQLLGYHIPDGVYELEAALGLGAVRIAISKNNGAYQTDTSK